MAVLNLKGKELSAVRLLDGTELHCSVAVKKWMAARCSALNSAHYGDQILQYYGDFG